MPNYYATDYFQQEIDKIKRFIETSALKKPKLTSLQVALIDEPYRNPWNAVKLVKVDQQTLDEWTDEVIDIPQLENVACPGCVLEPDEVTHGLFVEHFNHENYFHLNPPVLTDQNYSCESIALLDSFKPISLHNDSDNIILGKEVSDAVTEDEPIVLTSEKFCDKSVKLDHPICYNLPQPSLANINDIQAISCKLDHHQNNSTCEEPPPSPYTDNWNMRKLDFEQPMLNVHNNPTSVVNLIASNQYAIEPIPDEPLHKLIKLNHNAPNIILDEWRLEQPKLKTSSPDIDYFIDTNYLQQEVVPSSELVGSLHWNPFEVIAANIEITTASVSKQFIFEGDAEGIEKDDVEVRQENYLWVEEELHLERNDSIHKKSEMIPLNQVPTPLISKTIPAYVQVDAKQPNYQNSTKLNKIQLPENIFASNMASNSVEAFMALRKKTSTLPIQNNISTSPQNCKLKTSMINEIEVSADEPTTKIVHRITSYCLPYIEKLVLKNILAETSNFNQLDVSNMEFLLKEHDADPETCNVIKLLIPLKHVITIALQVSTDLAAESLANIDIIDEKFELCKRDVNHIQSEITVSGHRTVKIMQLCKIVEEHKGVVLVLVAGPIEVKTVIFDLLAKILPVKVGKQIGISDCKLFVIHRNEIDSNFPWKIFSVVIEFNNPAPCLEITLQQYRIKHYILTTILNEMYSKKILKGLKIIAFSSLDICILQQLESVYGFDVFQRQCQDPFSTESLIIDERSCIIIVKSLNDIKLVKILSSLFIKLSLKYIMCSVIIDVSTCHVPELYSLIFASISHFDKSLFNIMVYYCLTIDTICARILTIIEEAQHNIAPEWSSTGLWTKRTWLCEDESNHERILTTFPSINSYVAQVMLTTYTLQELCELSLDDALQTLVVIPQRFVRLFHELLHKRVTEIHGRKGSVADKQAGRIQGTSGIVENKPERKVNFDFTRSQSVRYTLNEHSRFTPDHGPCKEIDNNLFNTPNYFRPPAPSMPHSSNMMPRTPHKPQSIVKPMFFCDQRPNKEDSFSKGKAKRQIIEDNKHSFSFSKKRKVLITKDRISLDGQTKLFIEQ